MTRMPVDFGYDMTFVLFFEQSYLKMSSVCFGKKLIKVSFYPPNLYKCQAFAPVTPQNLIVLLNLVCLHLYICTEKRIALAVCWLKLRHSLVITAISMTKLCNLFLVVRQAMCAPPDPTGWSSGLDATRAKGKTFSGNHVQSGQGQSMYI